MQEKLLKNEGMVLKKISIIKTQEIEIKIPEHLDFFNKTKEISNFEEFNLRLVH